MDPLARHPLPRLRSHNLTAPTADDLRRALHGASPSGWEQAWTDVCEKSGAERGACLLDVSELVALGRAASELEGPLGLAGRAFAVRVASYRAIAESPTSVGFATRDWGRAALERLLSNRFPDPERMAEIDDLNMFSGASRARLDKAAKQAADRFATPVALVSVVLEGAQEFAGSHGTSGWLDESAGSPVEWSFCATLVRTREPYAVPDTKADVLQRTNPLVEKEGVGSYLGVPLITSRGQVLGSFCLISDMPRAYTPDEVQELQTLAEATVAEIERHRRSSENG